jgi:hypothetical protein
MSQEEYTRLLKYMVRKWGERLKLLTAHPLETESDKAGLLCDINDIANEINFTIDAP